MLPRTLSSTPLLVDAGEAAQVALLEPPDVAVAAVQGAAQPRRGTLGDVRRRFRRGEVGAELDELLAEPGDLPRLVEERSAVEHPGDELAHAREELEVAAPVPLGVVVEVHQADELAAGDEGHRQRAGEAPRAHGLGLVGAEPIVAEVGDRQRRVVEEGALQRRIAAGVEDLVAQVGIGAVARCS